MTPRELLEAFDTLADAPDGVKRLRELVLQLAVRGKLVRQDPADEPADALIGRLNAAQRELRASSTNELYELPALWAWTRFDDIAEIASNLVDPGRYPNEPHVAPDNIEKATGRLMSHRTIAEDGVTSSKHKFHPGQILYSKIRPNLSKVVRVDFGGLCSADMYPINPKIDRAYLHLYMLSRPFFDQVTADENRLAMPKVNQAQLSAVSVAVAPLAEQHRIVTRVDELMGLLDRLEAASTAHDEVRRAARDSALDALREAEDAGSFELAWNRIYGQMNALVNTSEDILPLRKTIRHLAVRGRIVPRNAVEQTAEELLEEVHAERKRRWPSQKKPYLRPSHREWEGLSDGLPQGWSVASVEELTDPVRTVSYGILMPGEDVPGGVPYVKVKNIHANKGLIIVNEVRRTTVEIHRKYLRSELKAGDVLVSIRGTVGKIAPVPAALEGGNVTQDSARLAFLEPMHVPYLMLVLQSPPIQAYWAELSKGAAVQGLNIGDLRPTPLPIPPLAEQHRIVAKVDALMRLCDDLEAQLTVEQELQAQFAAAAVHHFDV